MAVRALVLALPMAVACGEPPESDFYAPASGSQSASATNAVATIGTSTSSVTSTSSTSSTTSSSTTGGPSTSSTSMGAGGSSSGSTGSTSTGGAGTVSCDELPMWQGNNPEFTLSPGDEIQHNGRRYRALEPVSYPNAECAPDAPMDWCAGWFEDLGPC